MMIWHICVGNPVSVPLNYVIHYTMRVNGTQRHLVNAMI